MNKLPDLNLLNSLVPISQFNAGKANKIFKEVEEVGTKIVVKSNKPVCVLLSMDEYQRLMEMAEGNK